MVPSMRDGPGSRLPAWLPCEVSGNGPQAKREVPFHGLREVGDHNVVAVQERPPMASLCEQHTKRFLVPHLLGPNSWNPGDDGA